MKYFKCDVDDNDYLRVSHKVYKRNKHGVEFNIMRQGIENIDFIDLVILTKEKYN